MTLQEIKDYASTLNLVFSDEDAQGMCWIQSLCGTQSMRQ